MSFEDAKRFASKMMMGMEVSELDSLAQSAISEMANMVCANACTQFSKADIGGLDISPPTLMMGTGGMATLPVPQANLSLILTVMVSRSNCTLAWPETSENSRPLLKVRAVFAKNRMLGYLLALLGTWDGRGFTKNIYFILLQK